MSDWSVLLGGITIHLLLYLYNLCILLNLLSFWICMKNLPMDIMQQTVYHVGYMYIIYLELSLFDCKHILQVTMCTKIFNTLHRIGGIFVKTKTKQKESGHIAHRIIINIILYKRQTPTINSKLIVTVYVFVCHTFSSHPFYFDLYSARVIFYLSSGFYF